MSMKFVTVSTFVLALSLSGEAFAAGSSASALFNGQVADTCILAATNAGTLTSSADYKQLSSANAGGAQSTLTATSTSSAYKIKTIAPSSFTSGDSTNVSFSSNYALTGATNQSSVPGTNATPLAQGNTQVAVDLSAQKASGTFPAGNYAAAVTVRCE